MSEQSGPITREQVERAIAKPRNIDYRELPMWWREWAPDYVIAAEAADDWDAEHAALTRWRDELAAAEPVLPKPAEDSPERLRERRERLGWTTAYAGHWVPWFDHTDVERAESGKGIPAFVARYAAALSAEEARRAAVGAWAAGGGVLHYSRPTEPERPAPRFKVGDRVTSGLGGPWKIGRVEWGRLVPEADCDEWVYHHASGNVSACESVLALAWTPTPASPPAPEVVDVPQPRIVVKRCDEVEAEWTSADATILIVTHDALDDAIFVPIALLRAMLAAIDAQQGGAS